MKIDNLNQWLGILANFGVLIGIVFLILEIGQTNRIAERDSRESNIDSQIEINLALLENQQLIELLPLLRNPTADLSPIEEEQARLLGNTYVYRWLRLGMQYSTETIPDVNLQAGLLGISSTIEDLPGLIPYIAKSLESLGATPEVSSLVATHIWEQILN